MSKAHRKPSGQVGGIASVEYTGFHTGLLVSLLLDQKTRQPPGLIHCSENSHPEGIPFEQQFRAHFHAVAILEAES